MEGRIQLYTGNGKGKTTAAFGLALRAAGSGRRTYILQFMKGQHYGELDGAKMLGGLVTVEQCGSPEFCRPTDADRDRHRALAAKGIARAKELIGAGYDIVVLDEIVTALLLGLVTMDDVNALLALRPAATELVFTGRGAPEELIARCDLVTEMKEVKHYYAAGVQAREGIEF